jgi:hypothetical protein
VDGAGLRLVASASATAVPAPPDPAAYQARCVEDYQLSQAARGFSTLTIDNGTATLERFLAACGRPAWEVTCEDIDRVVGGLAEVGMATSTRRGSAFLLHHPNPSAAGQPFSGLSTRQQALDVVQLHKLLLEKVLHLSEDSIRNQQNISYIRDAYEALARVREGRADIAFLINPCRMSQVRDIAFAGDVMPQKSTDFYPKLLSGITIYALD